MSGTSPNPTNPRGRREKAPEATGRRRRLHARTKWIIRGLAAASVAVILLAALIVQTAVIPATVRGQVEAALGCNFEAERVRLTADGRIVVRGLRLTVPGLPGTEGTFVEARRAEIDLDGWLSPRPTRIRLHDPVFRVSLSRDDGSINIDALTAPRPAAAPLTAVRAPRIDALGGRLEFGEHGDGGYHPLKTVPVWGAIAPVGTAGLYRVLLHETEPPFADDRAMVLDGRLNLATSEIDVVLLGASLDEWPSETMPSTIRDVWARLDMHGRVPHVGLNYTTDDGLSANMKIEDVSMTALIPADPEEVGADEPLRLSDVSGTLQLSRAGLRADLKATVGDLASDVRFTTYGTDLNAPIRCEIISERFQVRESPDLLPYAPPIVRRRFASFSGPTALVDARVLILRGEPREDGPGPVSVSGSIMFENGSAAYEHFPYPVENLRGRVRFTDDEIHIEHIHGRGPTGAIISAQGVIAPPTDGAMVNIDVLALDIPVDDVLTEALPEGRKRILDALFNEQRYSELIAAGLIADPDRHAPAPDDPADRPPLFTPGGTARLDINIRRELGDASDWSYSVGIKFDEAGLLLDTFPYPILARDVALNLTEHEAVLEHGRFQGIRGGSAQFGARILFASEQQPEFQPFFTVRATDIPVDDLLLHAIPERLTLEGPRDDEQPATAAAIDPDGGFSVKRLLHDLNLEGLVSCAADIAPLPDGRTGFDVSVDIDSMRARPAAQGENPEAALEDLRGSVRVTQDLLEVPLLTARLRPLAADPPRTETRADLSMTMRADFGPGQRQQVRGTVEARRLDLDSPIESLVRLFSLEAAQTLLSLRDARRPSGRVDAQIDFHADRDQPLRTAVTLNNLRAVAFDALGARVEAEHVAGAVRVDTTPELRVTFDNARAPLAFAGMYAGEASLHGVVAVDPRQGRIAPATDLRAALAGGRFESEFVHALLNAAQSERAAEAIEHAQLRGGFDADVDIRAPRPRADTQTTTLDITGQIAPTSLEMIYNGAQLDFPQISGRVTFNGAEGTAENLTAASADGWRFGYDGGWQIEDGSRLSLFGRIDLEGETFTPTLLAALPEQVADALDALDFDVRAGFAMPGARISLRRAENPDDDSLAFTGALSFSDASFNVGVDAERCDGALAIHVERLPGEPRPSLDLTLEADRLRLAGFAMRNAHARIVTGPDRHTLLIPHAAAHAHGGRVSATGTFWPRAGGENGADAYYEMDISLAGADYASLLADLDRRGVIDEITPDDQPDTAPITGRRGSVDAWLTLSGAPGDHRNRRGRGALRIAGGDVVRMPFIVTLMELSNLQIPTGDAMDFFQTTFHVLGNRVVVEDAAAMSDNLSIVGAGTVTLPDLALDMRFNSRATRRLPLWSAFVEAVRNEFISTSVTGTLTNPRFRTETLRTTRRLLGSIIAPGSTGVEGASPDRAALVERQRTRHASGGAAPPVRPLNAPE